MKLLEKLKIEYRISLLMGLVALFFSLLAGLASGINFSVIIIRSFIFLAVFGLIGYAVVFVLKRYVPEVKELKNIQKGSSDVPNTEYKPMEKGATGVDDTLSQSGSVPDYSEPADDSDTSSLSSTEGKFTPFNEGDFDHLNTVSPKVEDGKLGKHIVVNEKEVKYEPQIMAKAIRTMMSRDKE